jgi:RNA polymerase sigma-70 factor (ECF subfamily)
VSHTPKPLDPESVYREHVHQVGRWVVRLGGPAVDVEDTVHEVFAVACSRLASFRGDSSLATWLFGITDKVVRNRRRKHRFWQWLTDPADRAVENLPGREPSPLRVFEQAEAAQNVYRILDALSENDRRILILFELEELSADQVAQLLGVNAGAARLRLHRARARFIKMYEREFPMAEPSLMGCEDVSR